MIDWPWGKRASFDEHGVIEILPDDGPVQYWVCPRVVDGWRPLTNQHLGACTRCQATIIYRVSDGSPTDPTVPKICTRCAEHLAAEE